MDVYVRRGMKGNKNCAQKYKYVFLESQTARMHLFSVPPTARAVTPTPLLRQALNNLSATPVLQHCDRTAPRLYVLITLYDYGCNKTDYCSHFWVHRCFRAFLMLWWDSSTLCWPSTNWVSVDGDFRKRTGKLKYFLTRIYLLVNYRMKSLYWQVMELCAWPTNWWKN
jgi:hypothetical protein